MGRLWIALVLLAGFTADANAFKIRLCGPSQHILPERNAKAVPINASMWVVAGGEQPYTLTGGTEDLVIKGVDAGAGVFGVPVARFSPRLLEPNHHYRFEASSGSTEFTTGGTIDTQPPAAPQIGTLSIVVSPVLSERPRILTLRLGGRFDSDTALLRVDIKDRIGTVTFVMIKPDNMPLCDLGFGVAPGKATVSIRAIDLAGNESPAAEIPTEIVADNQRPRGESDIVFPSHGCGTGATAMFVFGITVVGGFIIGICLIVILRQLRRRAEDPASPISLLVAEHAARSTRTRTGVFGGIGLAGLVAVISAGIPVFPFVFAIWTIPALRGFWIASAALRLIESANASAVATSSSIIVHAGAKRARLNLTPSELAAARRRGVPTAFTS